MRNGVEGLKLGCITVPHCLSLCFAVPHLLFLARFVHVYFDRQRNWDSHFAVCASFVSATFPTALSTFAFSTLLVADHWGSGMAGLRCSPAAMRIGSF